MPVWQESILLLGVALVLAIVLKAFFVQAFYIPSGSMEPGLVIGRPDPGREVVLLGRRRPGARRRPGLPGPRQLASARRAGQGPGTVKSLLEKVGLYPAGGHLVKRVIGVAGDTIKCCDNKGRISVDGVALDEPYLENAAQCNGPMIGCRWSAGPVPDGHLFVMGDHRDDSGDSSFHMCRPGQGDCFPGDEYVPTDLVVGKVFVLVWPRDHFGWIKRPATFEDLPEPR